MRVGVDATCWQSPRGYGRHVRALFGALVRQDTAARYAFVTETPEERWPLPSSAEVRLVSTGAPTARAASAQGRRSMRDLWLMSRALSARDFDILVFPTAYSYVPVLSSAKVVVMVHDVIREAFPELTLPTRRARLFWSAKAALARRQAHTVVTVSEYSRQALLRRFRLDPERVRVIGGASDPISRPLKQPQPTLRLRSLGVLGETPTLLYVGGFGSHKNLETLLRAVGALAGRDGLSELRLLLVGEHQDAFLSELQSLRELAGNLGLMDRVLFPGYLPDEELVVLMNLATALVLPSLMEGFGLPAVEAAACGCPVVATAESPLPAFLGEGALYFDPTRQDQLEQALCRVLGSQDLRTVMGQAGMEAARPLTWETAAREMAVLLAEVAAS